MSAFSQAVATHVPGCRPPRVVQLEPGDFASDWQNRPIRPVEIGLRLPSEDDVQTARLEADRRLAAVELSSEDLRTETWNDALMACAVARCLCDPSDIRSEFELIRLAEDTITQALTSNAIRKLFDEIQRLTIEQSPLAPEATDAELELLAALLASGAHAELGAVDQKSVRRFARYCLDLFPAEAE